MVCFSFSLCAFYLRLISYSIGIGLLFLFCSYSVCSGKFVYEEPKAGLRVDFVFRKGCRIGYAQLTCCNTTARTTLTQPVQLGLYNLSYTTLSIQLVQYNLANSTYPVQLVQYNSAKYNLVNTTRSVQLGQYKLPTDISRPTEKLESCSRT